MAKPLDAHEAWRAASEAGQILDQPDFPPGFAAREVVLGDNGSAPAWKVVTDGNGKTLAFEPAN